MQCIRRGFDAVLRNTSKKITYFRTAAIFYQKKRKPQHSNSFLFEGSYSYEKAFRLLVVFLLFPVRSPYETAKLQTRFLPFLQISQRMSFLVFARFWRRYVFSGFIGVSPFQPGAACVHRQHFLISRELPFRTFWESHFSYSIGVYLFGFLPS